MAVHTPVTHYVVVTDTPFLEICDISLHYSQIVEDLVIWFNEPVCEYRVNAVIAHRPHEILVVFPLSVFSYRKRDINFLACRIFKERFPFIYSEHHFVTCLTHFQCAFATCGSKTHCISLSPYFEVERSDVGWYGDVCIVGIYCRQGFDFPDILWSWSARMHYCYNCQY